MPDPIIGRRDTRTPNQAQNVIDMSNIIAELDPDASPFTSLLMKMRRQNAFQPKVEWLEDRSLIRWDKVTTAAADSATALIVANPNIFIAELVCRITATGEIVMVTAVNASANTITVTRGWGGTTAAAIPANSTIVVIGLAAKEGGLSPVAQTTDLTNQFNYTQIFRNSVKITGTRQATKLYGTGIGDLNYHRNKVGKDHIKDIERAFLLGERSEVISGGEIVRTTRGIMNYIQTNVTTISAPLTVQDMRQFAMKALKYGKSSKIMLCSPRLLDAFDMWGEKQTIRKTEESVYGVLITKFRTPWGTLGLINYKPFVEYDMDGYGIVLDMDALAYRSLRPTELRTDIQPNNADFREDEYLTECALEVRNESKHAIIKGVTTIA